MFGLDWFGGDEGLALSVLVDSCDPELVLCALLKVPGGGLAALDDTRAFLPASGALGLLLQHVLVNTGASVILGWFPF